MINTLVQNHIIVMYDGECGFCDHWVQWILRHNPSQKMRFIALQSEIGRKMLKRYNLNFDLKSIVVIRRDRAFLKTQAIAIILENLNNPIRHMRNLFYIIPTFIANVGYDIVAKYRYMILGKTDTCQIPTPEHRKFFLVS